MKGCWRAFSNLPSEFLLKCLSFVLFIIAEKFLQSNEAKESYNVLLLQLVAETSTDGLVRIAAAISFKNSVKRNWRIVSFDVSRKNIALRDDSGKLITNWKVNVLGSEYSVLKSK